MKVLRRFEWVGLERDCPHCHSKLLVETDDVQFTHLAGDYFYADCEMCATELRLDHTLLPLTVKQRAYNNIAPADPLPKEFR